MLCAGCHKQFTNIRSMKGSGGCITVTKPRGEAGGQWLSLKDVKLAQWMHPPPEHAEALPRSVEWNPGEDPEPGPGFCPHRPLPLWCHGELLPGWRVKLIKEMHCTWLAPAGGAGRASQGAPSGRTRSLKAQWDPSACPWCQGFWPLQSLGRFFFFF